MKSIYTAILTPLDSGGYAVRVPDVSGCVTTGGDLKEALDNAQDALCGCLCVLEDNGIDLPVSTAPERVAYDAGSVPALISIDTLKYREETDSRAVRQNVSMPAWLNNMAKRAGINCSAVLQAALKRELHISD